MQKIKFYKTFVTSVILQLSVGLFLTWLSWGGSRPFMPTLHDGPSILEMVWYNALFVIIVSTIILSISRWVFNSSQNPQRNFSILSRILIILSLVSIFGMYLASGL